MTSTGHRHERLAEEIRQEIEVMLAGELKDPRLACSITVSEVRLAADMRQATAFVRIQAQPAEQDEALAGLAAANGFIRHELTERLQLRRSPELSFILDRTPEYAQHIDDLLRTTKEGEK
jgi:ribosome-binding factor A